MGLLMLLAVTAIVCAAGLWLTRDSDAADFAVAGKSVGGFALFSSICATCVGPGLSLGFVGQGARSGWLMAMIAAGYGVQLALVGYVVVPMIRRHEGAVSPADLIVSGMTGAPRAVTASLAGLFSLLVMVGVTAILLRASGGLLAGITGEPAWLCAAAIGAIVASYSAMGGLAASIRTDLGQLIFFVTVIPIVALICFWSAGTSAADVIARGMELTRESANGLRGGAIFALALTFTIGDSLQPPFVSRALAAGSLGGARRAFVGAGLFTAIWMLGMNGVGVLAASLDVPTQDPDSVLTALSSTFAPAPIHFSLMFALLLVVISSHDSVLNSAVLIVVRDLVRGWDTGRGRSVSTWVITAIALWLSQALSSIVDGLLLLATIWAPSMLIPIIGGLALGERAGVAPLVALLSGMGGALGWALLRPDGTLPAIAAGLAASATGFVAAHALQTRRNTAEER